MTKTPDISIAYANGFPLTNRTRELVPLLEAHQGLVKAEIATVPWGDGWDVYAECLCDSADSALKATELVLNTIAGKFRAIIKVRPRPKADIQADAKHTAITRFIVIIRPGEWEDVDPNYDMVGFGRPASEAA